MNEWVIMAASAAFVALMVAFAAVLGFRENIRLDEEALRKLAAAEDASIEQWTIAPGARAAIARLSGEKLMAVRVMGDGVSTRIAPVQRTQIAVRGKGVSVAFADIGYPPLSLKMKEAPAEWLVSLAQGGQT